MVTPTLANTPTISTSYVARDNNFQLPTLLVANVRSIINKIDQLELVAQINQVEVICITESWLNTSVVDSMISLSNFIQFRNDRTYSCGGGVCIYIKEEIYCRRLEHFEDPAIESLWLLLRPKRLPRSISALLLAVIYQTTSSGANENFELYNHIQRNVESFLSLHPDGLVFVTGNFNPVSTLFDEKRLKRLSGLTQIIKVPTRHNAILDWCLTNAKKVVFDVSQLPPIGSSDHNAILIKPHKDRLKNSCNKRVCKRDLRDSSIRHFGQTTTSTDWTEIFEIPDPNLKYRRFNEVVSAMMDCFFPNKPTSVRESDKPWMTSSLKSSISKRQKSLHKYGRNSQAYRFWRNKVQRDVKVARRKYYANSVQKLKSANPSRWWKEVKSIGGLSSRES